MRIHRSPEISVDMAMAIIRISVSGAWIIIFSVKCHICCACSSILLSASSWLYLRSSINSLEPSAFMQIHCPSKIIYNFESSMIKICLSHCDTKNRISSALLFLFERKALHYLIWDEPTSFKLSFTGRTISSSSILYWVFVVHIKYDIYSLIKTFFLLQILIDHLRTCCKYDQYTWTFKLRPFHQIRKQRVWNTVSSSNNFFKLKHKLWFTCFHQFTVTCCKCPENMTKMITKYIFQINLSVLLH